MNYGILKFYRTKHDKICTYIVFLGLMKKAAALQQGLRNYVPMLYSTVFTRGGDCTS